VNIQNCDCNLEHHHNLLHAKLAVPIPSPLLPSKEHVAKVDVLCRKVQKNIENYDLMNASEVENCTKVQVRRCDNQSAVDVENAQSVTQYYSVGGNTDLNHTVYEPMQSVEVTELGPTELASTGEAATAPADISNDEQSLVHNSVSFSELQYITVECEGLPQSITALRDLGAEVSLIKADLIKDLDMPIFGKISIRGVFGEPVIAEPVIAELVSLKVKPYPSPGYENIAPYLNIVFAACALTSDVSMILCGSAVDQLDNLAAYNVVKPFGVSQMEKKRSSKP